jgi:hypothetical protein
VEIVEMVSDPMIDLAKREFGTSNGRTVSHIKRHTALQ